MQHREEEPAACARPSTPPPAEAGSLVSPGSPEAPGSPAPAGPLAAPLTPPQALEGRLQVCSNLGFVLVRLQPGLFGCHFASSRAFSTGVPRVPQGCWVGKHLCVPWSFSDSERA